MEEEEEFEDVDELFQPGWVKKEEPEEEEEGVTEKGLPRRNKWQTGVVAFAHDAYQVEPTKERISSLKKTNSSFFHWILKSFIWRCFEILCETGAYKKLKKTLKKTPRKDKSKKEPVKTEPVEIVDESMVISDDEEDVVEISENNGEEKKEESGDEFDTTVEEDEEDGEVQD